LSAINNSPAKAPLKDRLIPWYFVAAFMVVFLVNGIFVYVATSTNRGVVTEHAYEKGIHYNQVLAAKRQQESLDWKTNVAFEDGVLSVMLSQATGAPLKQAQVQAFIRRPIEGGPEHRLLLKETQTGHYEAPLLLPKSGQWDVTVSILWNNTPFQMNTRLIVK